MSEKETKTTLGQVQPSLQALFHRSVYRDRQRKQFNVANAQYRRAGAPTTIVLNKRCNKEFIPEQTLWACRMAKTMADGRSKRHDALMDVANGKDDNPRANGLLSGEPWPADWSQGTIMTQNCLKTRHF